jgi:hypothetical protein
MSFKFRFSKNELLKLFLVCALPIHFWTIFIIISDGALIDKRNLWYFAGFSGYLLVFALLESFLFFFFIVGLSFLFPKEWDGKIPLAVSAAIALVIGFWAVANQAFFFLNDKSLSWFSWILLRVQHRQSLIYPIFVAIIAISAAVPVYALSNGKKTREVTLPVIENISMLSYLYLGFDLLGLIVIIVRSSY